MFITPNKGNKIIYLMDKVFKNKGGEFYCEKIADGFFRGSQPNAKDIVEISRKHGIKTIVNLKTISPEDFQQMSEIAKEQGITYINIPLNPFNIKKYLSSIIEMVKRGTKDNPTFIHCTYGKDRTGFVSGLVKFFKTKLSPSEIIQDLQAHGFRNLLFPSMKNKLIEITANA